MTSGWLGNLKNNEIFDKERKGKRTGWKGADEGESSETGWSEGWGEKEDVILEAKGR